MSHCYMEKSGNGPLMVGWVSSLIAGRWTSRGMVYEIQFWGKWKADLEDVRAIETQFCDPWY